MTKLYDKIKTLLQVNPEFRDSDAKLFWNICERKYLVTPTGFISEHNFITARPSFGSVSRARRKVQENHPELRSSEQVQKYKDANEAMKGTLPYHVEF